MSDALREVLNIRDEQLRRCGEENTRLQKENEDLRTREKFLLGGIAYLDDQDHWYLDQAPDIKAVLVKDFGFARSSQ